jgi:hypothetical protein
MAMAVWGDEVAQNLDKKVRASIDRLVEDIRSSIQDIREAVDQQLEAALQSIQADANNLSIKPLLENALAEVEPPAPPVPPAPLAPQIVHAADAGKVRNAIRTVEHGKSQVEVLNALLEQCLTFGSRAALLILKGDAFSGWKALGFSRFGGNDEQVKRFTAAPGMIAEFDRLLREERVVSWDGANFVSRLGVSAGSKAVIVPMVIKDKVSAAMYVDVVEAELSNFDQAAIEVLVFTTGLLIDTLAIRKKVPSPSLSGEVGAVAAAPMPAATPAPAPAAAAPRPAAPVPAPPVAPAPAPAPPPAAPRPVAVPAPAPAPPPVAAPPRPAPAPGFSLGEVPVAQPTRPPAPPTAAPSFQTTAIPAMREPVAPVAPPPKPAPPPAHAPEPEESRPSTQFIPPPGLRGGAAHSTPQSEQARKHDEARRFARLLVSEIKLYNEAKVEQGRKNKDLYERLKEDIDRSRQMYDERIPDEVRKASNYFYEELVRILADGDASIMGL